MKNMLRGLGFWKDFTYRIRVEFYYPETKEEKKTYVTDVNFSQKSFEFKTLEEIKKEKKQIKIFKLDEAIELMNSMVCNGYTALIEPYFE